MFGIRLCLNNIYKKVSDEDIFSVLAPNSKLGAFFSIRAERDKSASLKRTNGKLYLKDFGDPTQPKAETWNEFLARKEGWDIHTREGFINTLVWANRRFNLGLREPSTEDIADYSSTYTGSVNRGFTGLKTYNKTPTVIRVKRRKWNKEDLAYWEQYGLSLEWLVSKNISPISHYWVIKGEDSKLFYCTNKMTFVYTYYEINGIFLYKLYSPLEINFRWISNVNANVIENWRFIDKNHRRKNLIIQSSLKDIGVMEHFRDTYNIFKDYDFISPIAEGIWFSDWEIIRAEYTKVIYYGNNDYDNKDNPGLGYARKYAREFFLPFYVNPSWALASDISDYRKKEGEVKTKKLLIDAEKVIELL